MTQHKRPHLMDLCNPHTISALTTCYPTNSTPTCHTSINALNAQPQYHIPPLPRYPPPSPPQYQKSLGKAVNIPHTPKCPIRKDPLLYPPQPLHPAYDPPVTPVEQTMVVSQDRDILLKLGHEASFK